VGQRHLTLETTMSYYTRPFPREDDEHHELDNPGPPPPLPGRTMTARYRGTCADTGAAIAPGDTINFDRATRRTVLVAKASGQAPAGRYISDVIRTSGGTFYRNKRGRCEDAPCCGCCTI
jgi:hypothetical protein